MVNIDKKSKNILFCSKKLIALMKKREKNFLGMHLKRVLIPFLVV